jgi:hypothetical protein
MGEYKGQTELSPPASYPSAMVRDNAITISPYPSTMLAYTKTTQIPRVPDPTDRQVKNLGTLNGTMNRNFNFTLILII